MPDNFFVNEIKASRLEKDAVFVAVDSHKTGDYAPYLLRSDDRGPHVDVDRGRPAGARGWCGPSRRIT